MEDGKWKKERPWDYVMTYLSDFRHNPFTIYPTHRLLRVRGGVQSIFERLAACGRLEKVSGLGVILKDLSKDRLRSKDEGYTFGFYDGKSFYRFRLAEGFSPPRSSPLMEKLDVCVLHDKIIQPYFRIKTIEKSKEIDFTRDAHEACRMVRSGQFNLAIFLRPTALEEMITISKQGLKMPQKSTYFYPKLLSGLVFHRFDDGSPS